MTKFTKAQLKRWYKSCREAHVLPLVGFGGEYWIVLGISDDNTVQLLSMNQRELKFIDSVTLIDEGKYREENFTIGD